MLMAQNFEVISGKLNVVKIWTHRNYAYK